MTVRNKILIYNGPGTENTEVVRKSVEAATTNIFTGVTNLERFEIDFMSWETFHTLDWDRNVKLLILPGGKDLPYVEKITDDSIASIQTFIKGGGSFLGLCAGAYFSCSYVEFEKGTSMEVCGSRKLKLFEGIGRGSVYPGFVYESTSGSRMAPLILSESIPSTTSSNTPSVISAYYDGGGEFIPYKHFTDFETLACYKDYPNKLAIVSRYIASGKVVLSFVHPEMNVRYLDRNNYTVEQWDAMVKGDKQQTALFGHLLSFLLY